MASSSNPPHVTSSISDQELAYLYASNTNVSNFVSVKLSSDSNYHLWKEQMLCLLAAHEMRHLVVAGPTDSSLKTNEKYDCSLLEKKYDSLLRGWIFGSVSEDVLRIVVDHDSAKLVWDELGLYFDKTNRKTSDQQDSASTKADTTVETATDKGTSSAKLEGKDEEETQIGTEDADPTKAHREIVTEDTTSEAKGEDEDAIKKKLAEETETGDKDMDPDSEGKHKTDTPVGAAAALAAALGAVVAVAADSTLSAKILCQVILDGDWTESLNMLLRVDKDVLKKKVNSDGNTVLHIAVGISRNDFVRKILWLIDDDLTKIKNVNGSTVLHIAAIVGNTNAAELLVKKNKNLLHIEDNQHKIPLVKAYENMHFNTTAFLLHAADVDKSNTKAPSALNVDAKISIDNLVQAISAKQYDFASKLMNKKPEYVVSGDNVLMALARTFPSGLDNGETIIYPNLDSICKTILKRSKELFYILAHSYTTLKEIIWPYLRCQNKFEDLVEHICLILICVPLVTIYWMCLLILLLLLMAYFPFFMLYYVLWKFAVILHVPCIKNIELKRKEYEEAKKVLELVCRKIKDRSPDNSSIIRDSDLYTRPILEAACQDAYAVVDEILLRWPEAILCKDESGYDLIQLAIMHRSENIYNLIYLIGERKNVYKTIEDSSKNNMLHLAGRLAPLNKLKRRAGAALQLQRELQWYQEVEKHVFPTCVTKVNIFMETPEMVFTREHENLMKEGEKWFKTVAESCSITAALITTIVFAAAITVPGGSSQQGFPVFINGTTFAIFALSNAISLFSSVTALLVFLSVLTARFAEQDFLRRLPRRLLIGLCTLLISTTAMIVAFGATLFLVFYHHKPRMLALICGLASLPIAIFFIVQFPLILDLFRWTYLFKFGKNKHHYSKFSPNDIRFFFGK